MPSSVEELVELLDLEVIEDNLFRGRQPDTVMQRVFGGQVLAQSLVAAVRTVPEPFACHSLHSYFLRPGDTKVPIIYDVEAIRDGRSFCTRRVAARQHGRPIFFLTANFQVPEKGLEHQDVMPEVPSPEECAPTPRADVSLQAGLAARVGRARRTPGRGLARGRQPGHRAPPGSLAVVDPGEWLAPRRPGHPARGVHLRLRHDAAAGGARAARPLHRVGGDAGGLARPLDLVPPAVPGRRVVALRPGLAVRLGRPGPGPGPGLLPGRPARAPAWPRRA